METAAHIWSKQPQASARKTKLYFKTLANYKTFFGMTQELENWAGNLEFGMSGISRFIQNKSTRII